MKLNMSIAASVLLVLTGCNYSNTMRSRTITDETYFHWPSQRLLEKVKK